MIIFTKCYFRCIDLGNKLGSETLLACRSKFLKLHQEDLLQVLHNFDAFWHMLFQELNTTILRSMIVELLQVIFCCLMEVYHR